MSKKNLGGRLTKAIAHLFNIDTREVSLVDHPAIDEPFVEVKSANKQEEDAMDKKAIEELIAAAIAPLADGVKALKAALEEQGTKFAEIGKLAEGSKAAGESLAQLVEEVKGLKAAHETLVKEADDRMAEIEEVLNKFTAPKSAKSSSQATTEDGKAKPQWPSFAGR